MRVFLTGGTGLIGQPLTESLIRRGWEVIALTRNPRGAGALAIRALGAQLVAGDVTDRVSMRTAMLGVGAVIHNAGWYEHGITRALHAKMHAINVQGTAATLGLAVELKIPRMIYTSSVAWFGPTGNVLADESFQRRVPPRSYYEHSKAEAHSIALQFQQRGAPLIIVCPAMVIGVGDQSAWGSFVRLFVRGIMPPFAWAPDAIYSHVHAQDVAEAIAAAMERGRSGETYILAGEPKTMREILDIWNRTPGGMKARFWMARPIALLAATLAEPVLRLLGKPAFFSREVVASSLESWQYSAAKAERELGATFRTAEELWVDTLAAERDLARKGQTA